ncbi:MAG: nickel pincer cofactor biosynthesis protein LarC [Methanolinea sp.]|nr:nickel pincer cofactor biosynthesis protein LarC [Methanolinea sp.]
MRVLLFDPIRGAAGDMVCGALLDLGADAGTVTAAMRSVVGEPSIRVVERAGVRALSVDTRATAESRTLDEVISRVRSAEAPRAAIEMACRVFARIAAAEEEIHGKTPHFHEVGADDAVAEVVGACTALATLAVDAVGTLPVPLGGGTVGTHHGTYPVPAPATLSILEAAGIPVIYGPPGEGELCTPTGAALLAEMVTLPAGSVPRGRVVSSGYGAGDRDTPSCPNVLRAVLIEDLPGPRDDAVDILETNVDDVTAEEMGACAEALMAGGARDVSIVPCTMKKGRPGWLVRVVSAPWDSERLAGILARETGTLGVRCIPSAHRFVAGREERSVSISVGGRTYEIPVKCAVREGTVYSCKAEFARVHEVSRATSVPVREIARLAEGEAWRQLGRKIP